MSTSYPVMPEHLIDQAHAIISAALAELGYQPVQPMRVRLDDIPRFVFGDVPSTILHKAVNVARLSLGQPTVGFEEWNDTRLFFFDDTTR